MQATAERTTSRTTYEGWTFTGHVEERRKEMGVSKLRIIQAIERATKVYEQSAGRYSNDTHVVYESHPYKVITSENRIITIIWFTEDLTYARNNGVPADCADAHKATRMGFHDDPRYEAIQRMARRILEQRKAKAAANTCKVAA